MKTKLFNFNLPVELKEYLEQISKTRYMNVSQYIIDLIVEDKQKKQARINEQLLSAKPFTEEWLKKSPQPYSSGRIKKVGDYILFGFLETGPNSETLISFHPDEFGTIYQLSEKDESGKLLPIMIKKCNLQ